eukprot:gene44386-36430_t
MLGSLEPVGLGSVSKMLYGLPENDDQGVELFLGYFVGIEVSKVLSGLQKQQSTPAVLDLLEKFVPPQPPHIVHDRGRACKGRAPLTGATVAAALGSFRACGPDAAVDAALAALAPRVAAC